MVTDNSEGPDRCGMGGRGLELDDVRAALLSLPAIERAFVHLHRYERLALPDAARVLSLSQAAVDHLASRVYWRLGRLAHRPAEDRFESCPRATRLCAMSTALVSIAVHGPHLARARAHAATCSTCARALARDEMTLALIDTAFPLEPVEPAGLERIKEALLGKIRIF